MKKINAILLFAFVICLTSLSNALSMTMENSIYYPGETAISSVIVSNNESYAVNWSIEYGFGSMKFPPMFSIETLNLEPHEQKTLKYSMEITEYMPEGNYTAYVIIVDENMNTIDSGFTNFFVAGTDKYMDFSIVICKDQNFHQRESVFVLEEDIYIGYYSNVPDILVYATITYPDNSQSSITLPSRIIANQIGAYALYAKASKDGYNDYEKVSYFAVIENKPEIVEIHATAHTFTETTTTQPVTTIQEECYGYCGTISPSGCGCDASCVGRGDCCSDACSICEHCEAEEWIFQNLYLVFGGIIIVGVISVIAIVIHKNRKKPESDKI